jgi:SAM-dependent methyltransferase
MRLSVRPRWYGKEQKPTMRAEEQRLLQRYHERLAGLRKAGVPPGEFSPTKGPYAELYNQEVAIARRFVKPGDTVLDVGAGYGRLVGAVLDEGADKVFALEPDAKAVHELSERYADRSVCTVFGVAERMIMFEDDQLDLTLSIGNSLGMMWRVEGRWDELQCLQKKALSEMLRVTKREVAFIVYGKEVLESSLAAYESLQRNIAGIRDGLMLVEELKVEEKPYIMYDSQGGMVDRFVFQKFTREYLENLLADVGLQASQYSITGVPEGREYGFLVSIKP